MDILLKEVKQKLQNASAQIDLAISNYLTTRLGIDNINTINSLTINGKGTYDDRLDLLLKVSDFSTIEHGKITVFKDLCNRFSNLTYLNNLVQCFHLMPSNAHFLLIIYPQKHQLLNEDKFKLATYELIDDVLEIINHKTTIHKIKIIEDEMLPSTIGIKNMFSFFIRRAML
jgi:hypothetical protein